MKRFAALTLTIFLIACTRSVTGSYTPIPLYSTKIPITPTLNPVPVATETATPSCVDALLQVKIMPLGDSITYGEGDPNRGGYRTKLAEFLLEDGIAFDFVGSQRSGEAVLADPDNEGHPGWRITNIKDAIASEGWLETYQPDIILLHIGSNDLRNGRGIYARDHLSALLDDILVRLPHVHVIVAQIIPTRWGSEIDHQIYNNAIPNVAASKGGQVSVVDMQEILVKDDFMTLYHPSTSGYEKMAQAWRAAIHALGLQPNCAISQK
ncbi:MAG TPA: SGNH/GDSL hydrolase family protein [Anaerolineales bacterium]|nr:SGNH/GDSL hydrolase family protein [Anaerolineales bacterium]HMX72689.1 SGNH/GDSL hydrolase family protein [Anaerolineales bacterium]HNA54477.1 SGNH/GDSL hydrolase family protein [Anaerolineales bacterium]HNB85928.1 SGNH/GDSL hydrolase family protein [Anaerolineales bacterium]HNE68404.1 SGNH/GDSL hydrolase family protein [Anaerolineales bacterium]